MLKGPGYSGAFTFPLSNAARRRRHGRRGRCLARLTAFADGKAPATTVSSREWPKIAAVYDRAGGLKNRLFHKKRQEAACVEPIDALRVYARNRCGQTPDAGPHRHPHFSPCSSRTFPANGQCCRNHCRSHNRTGPCAWRAPYALSLIHI